MTTKLQIQQWLNYAKDQGCSHLIIVCDTFDFEDYPVYVEGGRTIAEKTISDWSQMAMQRVMEVYNLSMDIEEQLSRKSCWQL
jgi:hypothetical protein